MLRRVEPEILDRLPAHDPAAIKSRRDLRAVNFLMGNERWILRQAKRFSGVAQSGGITEIGAGEGRLATHLRQRLDGPEIECFDLAPRPAGLDAGIHWREENVLKAQPGKKGALIACLFLHHFEPPQIQALGRWCKGFQALCFVEPLRSAGAVLQGGLLHPFMSPVTRHDMRVSIRAGFCKGELPELLRLDPKQWRIEEQSTWRGGLRVLALRV